MCTGTDFSIDGGYSQEIVFSPTDMMKQLKVNSVDDNVGEGDEVIILNLITAVETNIINVTSDENSSAYITIIEDDSESEYHIAGKCSDT